MMWAESFLLFGSMAVRSWAGKKSVYQSRFHEVLSLIRPLGKTRMPNIQ
jgi:hypothetical protein